MKNRFSIMLSTVLAGLVVLASHSLAANERVDLKALLPKDLALVVRVDVKGLFEAKAFKAMEESILKRIDSYDEFMLFLKTAELYPYGEKDEEAEGQVREIILVKRNLDAANDDTSALVVGRVNLDYTRERIRGRIGADRVKELDYEGGKIYRFADLFRKGEAVYAVQLKGAIAFTLSEKEAREYADREKDTDKGLGKNEEIMKRVDALRNPARGSESTVWGLAFLSEERRKKFAESKDPEEMMLQYVQSVSLRIGFGKETEFVPENAAEITVECECTTETAVDFMKAALKVLREKLAAAFENVELKDLLQAADIRPGFLTSDKKLVVEMNLDDEALKSALESLGWMAFGPRDEGETEADEAGAESESDTNRGEEPAEE